MSGSPNSSLDARQPKFRVAPALLKVFWRPDDECPSPCGGRWY
jgi:hypothetical protein